MAHQREDVSASIGIRNDAGPSSLNRPTGRRGSPTSSSKGDRTARLLAAYDDAHAGKSASYFEVPASHFLARPADVRTTSSTTSRTAAIGDDLDRQQSAGNALVPLSSSPSSSSSHPFRSLAAQSSSQRRASQATDLRSETSLSLGEREIDTTAPVHPLSGLALNTQQEQHAHASTKAHVLLGGQQQRREHMPDTTTLAAADYDIDVRSGFLPPEPPVTRLEGIEEEIWEGMLDRAREIPLRIGGGGPGVSQESRREARRWRRDIRNMLILHPSPQLMSDIRYARRAHLVLSFLTHFYIHSQPEQTAAQEALALKQSGWFQHWRWGKLSSDDQDEVDEATGIYQSVVPASIAIPWVALSRHIDLPPILTYATTVLWNWTMRDPALGLCNENIDIATTFTGTPSEQHFYKTSLLIEMRGVEALTWMRRTLDEAFIADALSARRIRHFLLRLARVIDDLRKLLADMRTQCDPTVFYWGIRPWFNGCDSAVDPVSGEKGWIYEGVEEFAGQRQLFTGPSAGQSSLIHAIDVFLGVDHSSKPTRSSTTNSSSSKQENATFMERMQTYMPGHHRNFLTHLRNVSFVDDPNDDWKVRKTADEVAQDSMDLDDVSDEDIEEGVEQRRHETHPLRALLISDDAKYSDETQKHDIARLQAAYNSTLEALKHLRDEHMRVASLYIVQQMRTSPPAAYAKLSDTLTKTRRLSTRAQDSKRSAASMPDVVAVADNDPDRLEDHSSAKGTGGTDLVSFLKFCRSNTVKTLYRAT